MLDPNRQLDLDQSDQKFLGQRARAPGCTIERKNLPVLVIRRTQSGCANVAFRFETVSIEDLCSNDRQDGARSSHRGFGLESLPSALSNDETGSTVGSICVQVRNINISETVVLPVGTPRNILCPVGIRGFAFEVRRRTRFVAGRTLAVFSCEDALELELDKVPAEIPGV